MFIFVVGWYLWWCGTVGTVYSSFTYDNMPFVHYFDRKVCIAVFQQIRDWHNSAYTVVRAMQCSCGNWQLWGCQNSVTRELSEWSSWQEWPLASDLQWQGVEVKIVADLHNHARSVW